MLTKSSLLAAAYIHLIAIRAVAADAGVSSLCDVTETTAVIRVDRGELLISSALNFKSNLFVSVACIATDYTVQRIKIITQKQ